MLYVCNQCIHAYVSFVERGSDRNWSDLLVVSDFDRSKVIWRIPFSGLVQLFETAAKDWATIVSWVYDEELGDYRVTTN